MFDIFTRRRLLFFLLAVCFVTISIFFFARIAPSYSQYPSIQKEEVQTINECYLTEPVEIITLCEKCTAYERRSKPKVCLPTGFKEVVLCSKSNVKTIRSCQIPIHVQRKTFWLFEGVMLLVALFAVVNVHFRQKTLDKQMIDRIRRQIGEDDE